MPVTLDALNAASSDDFTAALGEIYEGSPWVAARVAEGRPYASVTALQAAMRDTVDNAEPDEILTLLKAHPTLAGRLARAGQLTAASRVEQGGLGLDRLSDAEYRRFDSANEAYETAFGFPFIICAKRHTRDSVLAEFERRLGHDREDEITTAIGEAHRIAAIRLAETVEGPGLPKVVGRLSTHVLDNATGKPAAGVAIRLYEVGASARALLLEARTNADGRTDTPLIGGGPLRIGRYELVFAIGDYYRGTLPGAATPFLDEVPVRFQIAEPEGQYHVPLLVTPWGYTTYRGS